MEFSVYGRLLLWCGICWCMWNSECESWLSHSRIGARGNVRKWLSNGNGNLCIINDEIMLDVDDKHVKYVKSLLGEANNVSIVHYRSKSSPSIRVFFPTKSIDSFGTSFSIFSLMLLGEDPDIDKERLQRILSIAKGDRNNRLPVELEAGKWSHFLSLTFPDMSLHRQLLPTLRQGVDAWELRVDLLADQSVHNIHRQIAYLRSFNPHIPIIYTVRTVSQLGKYPDDQYDQIEALLLEGIRAGVEWLDLETSLPEKVQQNIVDVIRRNPFYRQQTRLIGSFHTREPLNSISDTEVLNIVDKCLLPSQQADMIKIVTNATDTSDNHRLHLICQQFLKNRSNNSHRKSPSYIAVCIGSTGELSRVLNQYFTPVTHPSLTTIAAPGQLSVNELQIRRQFMSLLQKKSFYLFGCNVSYSLSPAMHNEAFHTLQLPHQYQLMDSPSIHDYSSFLEEQRTLGKYSSFGGASVTIPYKEGIIPYLDVLSPAAATIGAVNTIVPKHSTEPSPKPALQYIGHNTDWLGMFRPLSQLLSRSKLLMKDNNSNSIGIVIGAGGTARAACYTIIQLGLQLYVANRNISKAEEIAHRFNGTAIALSELSSSEWSASSVRVIISTLPAAANFTLPETFVNNRNNKSKPIVLDVVYNPALTPLLKQAKEIGCDIVQGATMLLQQGIEQFQLWHERQAPVYEMKSAIFISQVHSNSANDRRVPKIDSL